MEVWIVKGIINKDNRERNINNQCIHKKQGKHILLMLFIVSLLLFWLCIYAYSYNNHNYKDNENTKVLQYLDYFSIFFFAQKRKKWSNPYPLSTTRKKRTNANAKYRKLINYSMTKKVKVCSKRRATLFIREWYSLPTTNMTGSIIFASHWPKADSTQWTFTVPQPYA